MNEEYGHIPDGFLLNPEEIQNLRENKRYLTAQATQKIRKMKAKQQAEKIVEATMEHTLRPRGGNRERVVAAVLRELINQCGYDNYNVDGDHGILVINVRDVLGIIEVLENG
jgi:CRISPR/Cas system-associated protein Csm6